MAWDKNAINKPILETLSVIPTSVRNEMLNYIQSEMSSIVDNPDSIPRTYRLFATFLELLNDFGKICALPDPLDSATFAFDQLYDDEHDCYFDPVVEPIDYMNIDKIGDEENAIFLKSPYFDTFLDEVVASNHDRAIMRQFVNATATGNIKDLPKRLPDCFTTRDAGRLFFIYKYASYIEWSQCVAFQKDKVPFDSFVSLILGIYPKLKEKYPEIISEWEWYWSDKLMELSPIFSRLMGWKELGVNPTDNDHQNEALEAFLTIILYSGTMVRNWPDFIFSYALPDTVKDVYMSLKFSNFLKLHPEGNAFKTMYAAYCSEKRIKPLIYINQSLDIDSAGQNKLWITPTINGLHKKELSGRYNIIGRLFHILKEWGAFGEDIDELSLKTLFAYRFSGVLPIRDISEKLPWAKSKTELALLISIISEGWDGRPPYKMMQSFFDVKEINISALVKSADNPTTTNIKDLVLKAFA